MFDSDVPQLKSLPNASDAEIINSIVDKFLSYPWHSMSVGIRLHNGQDFHILANVVVYRAQVMTKS